MQIKKVTICQKSQEERGRTRIQMQASLQSPETPIRSEEIRGKAMAPSMGTNEGVKYLNRITVVNK